MGFLSGVGRALGGIVKQVAPSIIKAVAPAATKLLKGIVGDTFKAGGSFMNKLAGNLTGPLGGLAQKLLGKSFSKLMSMAEGGFEKLLQKLTSSVTQRFAPGLGNISLPSLNDVSRLTALISNQPGVSSSSSAATTNPTPGSSPAPSLISGTVGEIIKAATSGAPSTPPDPAKYGDLTDQNNMQRLMKDQAAYQASFTAMMNFWTMKSNIEKAGADTLRTIGGNVR